MNFNHNMLRTFTLCVFLLVLALPQGSASTAQELRQEIDSALSGKGPIRTDRSNLLEQLHVFSDNRAVKKTALSESDKQLIYAYRIYYKQHQECKGLNYQNNLLDGLSSSSELGCLEAPPSGNASKQAYFAFAKVPIWIETMNFQQHLLNDQTDFLTQWSRNSAQYFRLSNLYYPGTPYQLYYACMQENATEETPNPPACDPLLQEAQQVEAIYGNYRGTGINIGMASKGPTIQRSQIQGYQEFSQEELTRNQQILDLNGPTLNSQGEICENQTSLNIQVVNERITWYNQRETNLQSQEDMVDDWLQQVQQKTNLLIQATSEALLASNELAGIELGE